MMQHLASRVLIGVVLFTLVVAGILVARSRTARTEATGPQPSPADLSIKEVDLREESAGGQRWHLTADQASVFEREGRTALRKVRVRVEDGDRVWTITGEEGDLFNASKNFEVRRNVVLTDEGGLRLETSVLRWRAADRRLWTDVPVRIVRPGAVVRGAALVVDTEEEATTVQGRVHAEFAGGRGR